MRIYIRFSSQRTEAGLQDTASDDLLEAEKLCVRMAERVRSLVRS